MRMVSLFATVIAICFLESPNLSLAQLKCDSSLIYENHNMVDYGPVKVNAVKGVEIDSQGVPVPTVCMALFSEESHKFIAAAQTSDEGTFTIPNVTPGNYRLVAKLTPFCTANIPILIGKHAKEQLKVEMRPAGMDSCSFGEQVKTKS